MLFEINLIKLIDLCPIYKIPTALTSTGNLSILPPSNINSNSMNFYIFKMSCKVETKKLDGSALAYIGANSSKRGTEKGAKACYFKRDPRATKSW